jgi:hypothetical protein
MKKNKYDKGLDELLELLKKNPKLMKELVFEPNNCAQLLAQLNGRGAREMVGKPVKRFLEYVAGGRDGYPIGQCFGGTQALCAKGTKCGLCGGGTEPTSITPRRAIRRI